MTEPDYRSFENKANIGNTMDEEEEAKLRAEWKQWRKNKKKVWYL